MTFLCKYTIIYIEVSKNTYFLEKINPRYHLKEENNMAKLNMAKYDYFKKQPVTGEYELYLREEMNLLRQRRFEEFYDPYYDDYDLDFSPYDDCVLYVFDC